MSNKYACIIIPCYNESKRIDAAGIKRFAENNSSFHFLFVNDCSTDNTLQILKEIQQQTKTDTIEVLSNKINMGKAETIRNGVLHIGDKNMFSFICFWDADFSTPLEEIDWFMFFFNQYKSKKIFIGSRCKRMGAVIERKTYRQLFGRVFATVVSNMLRLPVYDTQCGAKFFTHEVAMQLFDKNFVSRWFFDVELLMRYKKMFGSEAALQDICEVPLRTWVHKNGSKLKLSDFVKVPFQLIKIYNAYRD